jgi:hypothetical protein
VSKSPFFNVIPKLRNDDPKETRYFSILFDAMQQNYETGVMYDNKTNLRHTVVMVQVRKHFREYGSPRFFNVDEEGVREFEVDEKFIDPAIDRDMREYSAMFKTKKFYPIQRIGRVDQETEDLKAKVNDAIKMAEVTTALDKEYPEIKNVEVIAEEEKKVE